MNMFENFRVDHAGRDDVTFAWDGFSGPCVLQGVADDLSFQTLGTFDGQTASVGRKDARGFHGFRAMSRGPACAVSSVILRKDCLPDPIRIGLSFVAGYDGSVFAVLAHKGMCDQYVLYDVTNGSRVAAASEDFLFAVDGIVTGHVYMAEGFRNDGGTLRACAWSDDVSFAGVPDPAPCRGDPVLSVVMPVYNTARYLPRAAASVLGGSCHDIELILVDDGSTDGSLGMCLWYERAFPAVRVVRTDRKGPSGARNAGVDAAHGKYVAFIDSDDIVHPLAYQALLDASERTGKDISVMGTVIREGFGKTSAVLDPFRKDVPEEPVEIGFEAMMLPSPGKLYYFCSSCNKIVRRDVLMKVREPGPDDFVGGIMAYEDIAYTPALYSYANGFAFVYGVCYIWEKRHKALMDAASYYYPDSGIWKEIPFMSFMAAVWSRLFSSRNCNPERRELVDHHVVTHLRTSWEAWMDKYGDRYGFYLVRDFLFRSLHAADEEYVFSGNARIKAEPALTDFLAEAEAYVRSSRVMVAWRGTRESDFDEFVGSNPSFEHWPARKPVTAGTTAKDASRYSDRQRRLMFRRFTSGDTMTVCRSLSTRIPPGPEAAQTHASHAGPARVKAVADGLEYVGFASDRCIIPHMRATGHAWASDGMVSFLDLSRRFYGTEPGTPGLFCDIGANIGTTCLHFRRNLDSGVRILAFEPMPEIYAMLMENAQANGFGADVFTAVNAGVADKSGNSSMTLCEANPGGSSMSSKGRGVKVVRFDDYVRDARIDVSSIKYIWVDTEGFEASFLAGAMKTLEKIDVPVQMEFTPKFLAKYGHGKKFIDAAEALYESYVVVSDPGMTVHPVSRLRRYFNDDFTMKTNVQFDIFLLKHGRA